MADALMKVTKSMECPICLFTFIGSKMLSCSHTFCKNCLENLLACHGNYQIRCPVCRAVTQVPNQDVSNLQVNFALKNLIEEMKGHHQICTNCKSAEKPETVVYCQDCGMYLCTTCLNIHSQWENFVGHEVMAMSEILSGKRSVRRYRKCRKHPKEDEECFCSDCRIFTCFRCLIMQHREKGHKVIEAAAYESRHMESIENIKLKVENKRSCFQKYIAFIDEQKELVDSVKNQCTDDINKTYDDALRQLTENREILLGEVKKRTEDAENKLKKMKTSAQKYINQLSTIADMVTNRTSIPLDMDTLAAHDTLCEELREGFDQEDPDYEQPRKAGKKVNSVSFKRNARKDELSLGEIVHVVVKNVALPTRNSMNAMVSTPDGGMAVGCSTGGIGIFSSDGQLLQTVLKDIKVYGVGFLSDSRCAVIDTSNNISLYTPEYTKLNVIFETVSHEVGGIPKLTVDGTDLIYVSYREAKKVQVFSTAGGQAIKEIPFNSYVPEQITSYNDSLITVSYDNVRLVDKEGVIQHGFRKPNNFPCPAVTQENTILIATVKHNEGLVSIDEYTNELKHITDLVNDYKIEKPVRSWYYLQQYRSGEIAFCTPNKLYIFFCK